MIKKETETDFVRDIKDSLHKHKLEPDEAWSLIAYAAGTLIDQCGGDYLEKSLAFINHFTHHGRVLNAIRRAPKKELK